MLKLIKHEFRRNRTGLLVMLGIAAALFLLAPLGAALKREALMAISVAGLFAYSFAAYIVVLVRGVTAYSDELKNKTGYLLLMLPRSTTAILFSKLLFTVFFGFVMLGICATALAGSCTIFVGEIYEIKGIINIIKYALANMDFPLQELGILAVFGILSVLSSVLSLVSVCYLSTTLSATILQNRKGRGLVTTALVLGITSALSFVNELLTGANDIQNVISYADGFVFFLPSFILYLAATVLFTWLSAVLLKKKVSL